MDKKFMSWASLRVKFSTLWMTSLRKERNKQQIGRKSLQNSSLIKDWYSKYPENFWNSPERKQKPNYKWAGYLNTYLTKEDMQIANKSMKRCSLSYVIRESQMKTKRRHHYVPIKMVKIQGAHKHQMLVRLSSTKRFLLLLMGLQNGPAPLKEWQFPTKWNVLLIYYLVILLLAVTQWEENFCSQKILQMNTCSSFFMIAQTWKWEDLLQ